MAGLWLAAAAGAAPAPLLDRTPTDQIEVEAREDVLTLSWSDAEERLQGSIRPATPREGEPLQINLQVGSFEGEDFEGPVILTLREEGATHGQSLTVKKGAQQWQATFTPENDGPHLLDVSFRTTRHKALHAPLQVRPSRLPLRLGWAVLGLGCLALLGYTVRGLLRGERPEERALPSSEGGEPGLPVDTSSAPASGNPAAAQSPTPGADAPPGGEPTATPVDAGAQPPDSAPKTSEGEPPA
ncbi:MAG TPA: hypothetical protein VEU33_04315 [Archangium sp.]|nr:hypothetical protein [Archangium sp.]